MSTGKLDKKNGEFAHHFNDAEHEYQSSKEGVWIFLTSEILMFGALFVGYFIYSNLYPEVFLQGSKSTNWVLGATNTVVLLFSSLTMALPTRPVAPVIKTFIPLFLVKIYVLKR